jgi:hypothetical protein
MKLNGRLEDGAGELDRTILGVPRRAVDRQHRQSDVDRKSCGPARIVSIKSSTPDADCGHDRWNVALLKAAALGRPSASLRLGS